MRKLLLTAGCLMAFHVAQAQTAAAPSWSQEIKGSVAEASELNTGAPTAVGKDGSVFMTGNFTQPITIGQSYLEPIANSAYLIKYNSNGELAWSVDLKGAATITSVTTDENNNVYVAGTFADEVIVGSTEGSSQTISGKPGEIIEVSSFIASYDANGKLKAAKAFFTTPNAEITGSDFPFYLPDEGGCIFSINHLTASNGKLYASAVYSGDITMDEMNWTGMYSLVEGMMIFDRNSAGVFSLNPETLTGAASVALVQASEQSSDKTMSVESLNFTVSQDTVYVGFVGTGSLSYTAGGKQETIEMEVTEAGAAEHAYIVSAVKGTEVTTKKFGSVAHDKLASFDYIGKMTVENGNLYLGGTFQQTFAFDNSKQSKGSSDLFVAALDKNTLNVTWTAVSGIEEGDATYNNENFSAMTVADGKVSLYGNCEDTQNDIITSSTALDIENGVVTTAANAGFVTGADCNNGITAIQTISDQNVLLNVYKKETGINLPSYTLNAERVGNTFFFDQASDVQVYDLQGKVVMSLQAASSLNIEGLQKGIYILATQNGAVKVIR